MVKKQKEKQYQSAREQRRNSQIRSGSAAAAGTHGIQRRLPFSHCALTLTPFEKPVCSTAGIMFENAAIFPFLMKHKKDPVTGKNMTSRDLITLNMDKDEEGRWQCPVLTKPFANHTKIVAIITPAGNEANVYSYDAFHELNVKSKNYEDLTTGLKFDKTKDVIILNDPNDEDLNRRRDINTFYHVTHGRELEQGKDTGQVKHSMTATRIMEQLQKKKKEEEGKASSKKRPAENDARACSAPVVDGKRLKVLAEDVLGVKYTTGKTGGSLTSTSMAVSYQTQEREATQEEILQARFRVMRKLKKKGYVRLRTSMGDLTIELHCEIAPRTCTNFLGLCRAGKYDGTKFHRLIAGFMIQGGKANDGADDESLWGGAFADEFDDRLKHTGAGILSMANSGSNTNKQQFYMTFKSCHHLDRKHSVFGEVIEGTSVLEKMQKAETDKKERPVATITIIGTDILEDPAKNAEDRETRRLKALADSRQSKVERGKSTPKAPKAAPAETTSSVGRYLKKKVKEPVENDASNDNAANSQSGAVPSRLPPPPKKTSFGNFSGW